MAVETKVYKVSMDVVTTHTYEIEARTPDQAVNIAEDMLLEDSDLGEVQDREVLESDAFEIEGE